MVIRVVQAPAAQAAIPADRMGRVDLAVKVGRLLVIRVRQDRLGRAIQVSQGRLDPVIQVSLGRLDRVIQVSLGKDRRLATRAPLLPECQACLVPPDSCPAPVPPAARSRPSSTRMAAFFQTLVPIQGWLHDRGWRQGSRLLMIPYGLLPLIFLGLFSMSGNLHTPGWAYSLYIAPLWLLAFWYLIRPPKVTRLEILIAGGAIVWTIIWLNLVTITINDQLKNPLTLPEALVVGYNEESTKAIPVLVAALCLLWFRKQKLDPRWWMLLGTITGLHLRCRRAVPLYAAGDSRHPRGYLRLPGRRGHAAVLVPGIRRRLPACGLGRYLASSSASRSTTGDGGSRSCRSASASRPSCTR